MPIPSENLGKILRKRNWSCVVAESCTGGSLAAAITDTPGCSEWFDRGFVTYSNASKTEMLGVPAEMIATHGAVSESTALAMAMGALKASRAEVSVAITGVAGPGGGSPDKPVGTVWMAWVGYQIPTLSECYLFSGDRASIRRQAVQKALEVLIQQCKN